MIRKKPSSFNKEKSRNDIFKDMGIFNNKKKQTVKVSSFAEIERKVTKQGRNVPGIIHNMQYFLVDLKVYEDGIINCWDMVDLELFQKKQASGWLVTNIPDGANVSIFQLGIWKIKSGEWKHSNKTYYNYIQDVIRSMNPNMENLFDCFGRTTKMVGKVKTSYLPQGEGHPVRNDAPNHWKEDIHIGQNTHMFYQIEDKYRLVDLSVFGDGKIRIDYLDESSIITREELGYLVSERNICTEVPKGKTIEFYGLGQFVCDESYAIVPEDQKLAEIDDMIAELSGKPTSSKLCKAAYDDYLEDPTLANQAKLKKVYEKVPEHERQFLLGDMDVKDIPIRMIIYGEEEMKNWSHYIVAEENGHQLPNISVPKPKDL